ncbi:MAG: type II secretion system major pseudopilin GspG [Planctomycetota bacterium]|jgi:general secretion pathway protein G|nr:type II secretion system major pseudopilin GspG [Planctomycetota bacterium]
MRGRSFVSKTQTTAFTLIELLVVVVIMGILVAIVVRNVGGRVHQARVAAVKMNMRQLEEALDEFKIDHGNYPTTEQTLEALVKEPDSGTLEGKYPEDGYLDYIPKDPWGNEFYYSYRSDSENPIEIISLGRDGKEGGESEDKDLINYVELRN